MPAQYLVASRVALLSFPPQRGTQPQAPQPQADSTAGASPTLDVSFTGLRERERANPLASPKETKEKEALCILVRIWRR